MAQGGLSGYQSVVLIFSSAGVFEYIAMDYSTEMDLCEFIFLDRSMLDKRD